LNVRHADAAVKGTGAEDGYVVVKYFDLDVRAVGVVAVDGGVEQGFAYCWQWVCVLRIKR